MGVAFDTVGTDFDTVGVAFDTVGVVCTLELRLDNFNDTVLGDKGDNNGGSKEHMIR